MVMGVLKIGKNTVKIILLVITVIMAIALIASAWGGVVHPDTSRLLPLLTLGMPVVLIVNVVIMLAWLVVFKWRYALIPLAAMLCSWSPLSTVCPLNVFATNYDKDSTFTVMTFNVANFGPYNPKNHEPSKSMRYILDQDADFVLLQEGSQERDYLRLSNVEMMRSELEQKYPYYSDGYRDLMMLSKYPYHVVPDSAFDPLHEANGGIYAKAFDIDLPNGKQLRIISLHLRSIGMGEGDKDLYEDITRRGVNVNERSELRRIKASFYDKLRRAFERHAVEALIVRGILDSSPGNVVLCGDFNEAPSSYCYRTVRGSDMRDTFQDCGFGLTYTFHDRRMYFKIDHILYRGEMEAVDWHRDKAGDSDHYPQVATFVWK